MNNEQFSLFFGVRLPVSGLRLSVLILLCSLLSSSALFSQGRNLYFRSGTPDSTITNLINWSIGAPDLAGVASIPIEYTIYDTLIIPANIGYTKFVVGGTIDVATIKSMQPNTEIGLSYSGPNITLHGPLTVDSGDTLTFRTTFLTVKDTLHIAGAMTAGNGKYEGEFANISGIMTAGDADFFGDVTVSGNLQLSGTAYIRGHTNVSGNLRNSGTTHFQKDIYAPDGIIYCNNYCYVDGDHDATLTINEDGNSNLGALHFSKNGRNVWLNSNLNLPFTSINSVICLFFSQEHDIIVSGFNTSSGSGAGILRQFSGTTITTGSVHLYENYANRNRFDSCDFICRGSFYTYNGNHRIQSITFVGDGMYNYSISGHGGDTIKEVHIYNSGLNIDGSGNVHLCITDSFLLHNSCGLSLGNIAELDKRVRIACPTIQCTYPVNCNNKSSLFAYGYGYLHSSQPAVVIDGITFSCILFEGNWQSDKVNDLGLNAGNIEWLNSAVGRRYYWVGQNGNWHDPTKWAYTSGGTPLDSTACHPSILDTVILDGNSFSSSWQSIIVPKLAACKTLLCIDPNRNGSIAEANNSMLNIAGTARFGGLRNGGLDINTMMIGGGAGHSDSVYNNQKTINKDIVFRTLGNYELGDNLYATSETTGRLQHIQGLLKSNGNDISIGMFYSKTFDTATRTLDLVNSTITMAYSDYLLTPNLYLTKTALRWYNFAGSHFRSIAGSNNVVEIVGADWIFWNLTIAPVQIPNTYRNYLNFSNNSRNKFHTIRFNANVNINQGFTTDSLVVTPMFTFMFPYYTSPSDSVVILDYLGHGVPMSDCNVLETFIQSSSSTNALFKLGRRNVFDGAVLNYINVDNLGDSLIVRMTENNGTNSGKIRWEPAPDLPRRIFYWVGGTGNWDEAFHWSIGVSGGDPAITNPGECIPTEKDDVIFDTLSFDAPWQGVYLNRPHIYIHSMFWLHPVGDRWQPQMQPLSSTVNLHLTGHLEWAPNISVSSINVNFENDLNEPHSQTINANTYVSSINYSFTGTGRYDMINDFKMQSASFQVHSGSFFLHGYTIDGNGTSISINQATINDTIDLMDGMITTSGNLSISATNSHCFFAENTLVYKKQQRSTFLINNHSTDVLKFGVLKMDSVISDYGVRLYSNYSNPIFAKKITSPSYVNEVFGNFQCDTFHVTYVGDHNTEVILSSNSNFCLTVNNYFKTTATPCVPTIIKSENSTPAKIRFPRCLQINYYKLQHLTADISGLSCRPTVMLSGADNIDYHNFNIIPAPPLSAVIDTNFECNSLPYYHAPVPDATSYMWKINDSLISNNEDNIYIREIGSYYVLADFPGGTTCQVENTLNVMTAVPIPLIGFEITQEVCAMGDGAIYSTVTGNAVPPYTYFWSNGDTAHHLTNLSEGG